MQIIKPHVPSILGLEWNGLSSPQKEILVVKATKEIPVSYSNTVKVLIYINHNNWGKGLAVSSTSIICDIAHFLSMDSDRK